MAKIGQPRLYRLVLYYYLKLGCWTYTKGRPTAILPYFNEKRDNYGVFQHRL
jgi:hypothetical protein